MLPPLRGPARRWLLWLLAAALCLYYCWRLPAALLPGF
jgi:hypothetical protein